MEEFYDFGYGREWMKVLLLIQLTSLLFSLNVSADTAELVEGALGVGVATREKTKGEKGCELAFPWPSSYTPRSCRWPTAEPTPTVDPAAPAKNKKPFLQTQVGGKIGVAFEALNGIKPVDGAARVGEL